MVQPAEGREDRMYRIAWAIVAVMVWQAAAPAQTRVDQLLAGYGRIKSLTCDIRKDSSTPQGEGRMLSRVWFETPNRLLVENSTPFKRKILCDGQNLFYYADDGQTAIRQPFAEIRSDLSIQTRSVPASPMDHLLRLKGLPETNLAANAQFPERLGYTASNLFAVLSFDATNRLARLEFFTSPEMTNRYATTEYSRFEPAGQGVWLSLRQETEVKTDGQVKAREVRRFSALKVDPAIPPELFNHEKVFPGAVFIAPPAP